MARQVAALVFIALFAGSTGRASNEQSNLVTVGGRQVEVIQMGQGSPTLVLESGGGEAAAQWSELLPELAKQTHVIAYSRAGFGRSAPSAIPGSPQLSVSELRALLEALGQTGPIVLAGHSWGALLARLYVSTVPDRVVGLVLIDGTHEAQQASWDQVNPGFPFAEFMRSQVSEAPNPARDIIEQFITVAGRQRVEGMRPLPDIPLAVITAVKPACPPDVAWICSPAALRSWRDLHGEWVARSTSSLHIVSARTGHYVMNDQPSLIVHATRFVLEQVRAGTR
jgi:pimeloyl-ACP methyl ester carboxylesterase